MPVLVLDVVERWRRAASAGPVLWQDAWDRVLELYGPHWVDMEPVGRYTLVPDAAACGAIAFYVLAFRRSVPVEQITADDAEALLFQRGDVVGGLEAELIRLGHDLPELGHDLPEPGRATGVEQQEVDPVAACWLRLRHDSQPRTWDVLSEEAHMQAAIGPRLYNVAPSLRLKTTHG